MPHIESDAVEAGRLYRTTGRIASNKLRSPVYRAWERSHLQGANPLALQAEQLSSRDTERLLQQHNYLIDVVRPYFRMLSQAAGQEHHAIMLGDRQAILLDVIGDEQTVNGPEPFPQPGSLLSEAVAGANGIGTALAEENYVEIVSAEHFIEGFHPFSCQGIPLRNDKQEIVGVLSISLRRADARKRLTEILRCASHAIEAEFAIANLEKDVHRVLASQPDEYEPLEELRQDLIQVHQAARLKLEVISRMVAVHRWEYAAQLLKQAEQSIEIFRRRSEIWRNLASLETGSVQSLSLIESLNDVIDILSTEVAIRKVEVVTNWQEVITVLADPQTLLRNILRCFLQAFERAGQNGRVEVSVNKVQNSHLAQVNFMAIPAVNIDQCELTPYSFCLSVAKTKL
ncbi:GAF domain-containing protein [Tolypothrix sp. PCC 7910]|uniref:GAF domain-containing protein n=1 Tax=Tolypothrix sp. PCC 7910 TaxID=2099387 RepID=UPI001FCB8F90|nr:GAF domain-containing protein [Tolypothrix sp. PCC 7910]